MEFSYSNGKIRENVDLKEFFLLFIKHWYLYLSIILASLIMCTVFTFSTNRPSTYSSSGKIYIMNWDSENITTSAINISNYLSQDFYAIINDDYLFSTIKQDLGNKYSASQIKRFTSINFIEDSRVIEIVAKSPDAQVSKTIVDSVCAIAKEQYSNIMGKDCVKVVREATLDTTPTKPSTAKNFAIALILGIFACVAIVSAIYFFDTTISSTSDVEKYLKLNVLATIPYNNMKAQK